MMTLRNKLLGVIVVIAGFNLWTGSSLVGAAMEYPLKTAVFVEPSSAYGQIVWVDTKTGRLLLEERAGEYAGTQIEYVITPQKTTVTDSQDQEPQMGPLFSRSSQSGLPSRW